MHFLNGYSRHEIASHDRLSLFHSLFLPLYLGYIRKIRNYNPENRFHGYTGQEISPARRTSAHTSFNLPSDCVKCLLTLLKGIKLGKTARRADWWDAEVIIFDRVGRCLWVWTNIKIIMRVEILPPNCDFTIKNYPY